MYAFWVWNGRITVERFLGRKRSQPTALGSGFPPSLTRFRYLTSILGNAVVTRKPVQQGVFICQ